MTKKEFSSLLNRKWDFVNPKFFRNRNPTKTEKLFYLLFYKWYKEYKYRVKTNKQRLDLTWVQFDFNNYKKFP